MAIQLNNLNVGDKVRFGKYQVKNETKKDLIWKVAAKNHTGYPSNSVTLLTDKIIDIRGFDAKEPNNSNSDRQNYGNNNYKDSNLRQWLNKSGQPWFSKTHSADEPPTNAGTNNYNTGYDNRPGFLSAFNNDELQAILDTTLTVAKNTVTDGGGTEAVTDKVFLLSNTEVGLANEPGDAEGTKLALFDGNESRKAYPTQEAVSKSNYTNSNLNANSNWWYWLRTPDTSSSYNVRNVSTSGKLSGGNAYSGDNGVRPALNLKSDISVSDTPDYNGVYTIVYNTAPTIVLDTTNNRTLYENDVLNITGNARDTNSGDVVSVKYSINGGTVRAIASAISTGANIPFNKSLTFKQNKLLDGGTAITGDLAEGTQHTLKVWAEDDQGGKSTEQTRVFYVVPNRPAQLTINPFSPSEDLINTDRVTIDGSVSDPDGNNVTVSYKIANGSFREVYSGTDDDFQFQVQLLDLVEGKNTITIQAEDSYGAKTVKTLEVTKDRDEVPLKTAVARYKLSPPNGNAKGIVLWIEREVGDLEVNVEISARMNGEAENFVPMTKSSIAFVREGIEEDEWTFEANSPKENIIIKITMKRANTNSNKGITLISGVLS